MRFALVVSLVVVVAAVAAVHSVPALRKAVDWSAALAKYEEIHQTFLISVDHVMSVAVFDNPDVEMTLGPVLGWSYFSIYPLVVQFHNDIFDQTLNSTQARVYVEGMKQFYIDVQDEIQDYLDQLSSAAVDEIRVVFNATYNSTNDKGEELYVLLQE